MKPNPLPKGFKKKAETQAIEIRRKLGLSTTVACPARSVAELFGAIVAPVQCLEGLIRTSLRDEFPDTNSVAEQLALLQGQSCGFHAVAVIVKEHKMILYNADNSVARQESDIMHELAHIIQEHPGDCLQLNGDIGLREYNERYEAEAKWFGATLQIPESGLFELARAGYTTGQIATVYGASEEMAIFRRNILAIDRRLSYLKPAPVRR